MRNPNGYGSIIKMSGNRRRPFGVRITIGRKDNGSQIYKYIGYYTTRQEAMIALAEYNKAPYDLDANSLTFADVFNRFCDGSSFSDKIAKIHRTSFNQCPELHSLLFKNIRKVHLQSAIDKQETPTAKKNAAMLFRKLFAFAVENDVVQKDYAQYISTPPQPKKTPKLPFKREEIDLLWDNIGDVNAEILLMLCYSGMRIMELLNLEKTQINLAENYIITGSKTEAGRDRYIPIHPRTKPLIEKHYQNPTKWLIVNVNGTKPIRYDSFLSKRYRKLERKLSLRKGLSPHSTRHFFISELHRLGADKIAVQKIVGHKGDDVTEQTYTHIDKTYLHDIVSLIE